MAKSQNVLATTMFSCILIAFNFPGKKTNTCLTHAWSNQPGGDAWPQDRKQTRPNFARTRNQSAKLQGIPSSRKKKRTVQSLRCSLRRGRQAHLITDSQVIVYRSKVDHVRVRLEKAMLDWTILDSRSQPRPREVTFLADHSTIHAAGFGL